MVIPFSLSAEPFVDTNIWVYAHTATEQPGEDFRAARLVRCGDCRHHIHSTTSPGAGLGACRLPSGGRGEGAGYQLTTVSMEKVGTKEQSGSLWYGTAGLWPGIERICCDWEA